MAAPQRRRIDLHSLPRFSDGWTFVYTEHSRVDREDNGIVLVDLHGRVPVPAAAISTLLCGPGTTVTHGAMTLLADHGCSVCWVGENSVRFYASGSGETRRSANLLHQASVWADPEARMRVIERMYRKRFNPPLSAGLTLQQLRGMEGVRVREGYASASRASGVTWQGRNYKAQDWNAADPVNRALSCANSCLYGLCHAAIVSIGLSPALGFIHTGNALSFVFDVADLYKMDVTVPLAFAAAKEGTDGIERRTRQLCRDAFFAHGLLNRLVPDIQQVLGLKSDTAETLVHAAGQDEIAALWDPAGNLPGGANYAPPSQDAAEGDEGGETS